MAARRFVSPSRCVAELRRGSGGAWLASGVVGALRRTRVKRRECVYTPEQIKTLASRLGVNASYLAQQNMRDAEGWLFNLDGVMDEIGAVDYFRWLRRKWARIEILTNQCDGAREALASLARAASEEDPEQKARWIERANQKLQQADYSDGGRVAVPAGPKGRST